MDISEFENLKLGQTVYWHTQEAKIVNLDLSNNLEVIGVSIKNEVHKFGWPIVYEVLHLEKPKSSTRFWRWQICCLGDWSKTECYLDENGFRTSGGINFMVGVWAKHPKRKIEDDYIDL